MVPLGTTRTAKLLIDAAHRIAALGMDWRAYYTQKPNARTAHKGFPEGAVPRWNVYDHGVNNAEGALRWPNALYRINGSKADGEAALALVLRMLETRQGQVQSLFCADEVFCGRDPNRGTETCAVVEAMASLEISFATGRVSRVLPAAEPSNPTPTGATFNLTIETADGYEHKVRLALTLAPAALALALNLALP